MAAPAETKAVRSLPTPAPPLVVSEAVGTNGLRVGGSNTRSSNGTTGTGNRPRSGRSNGVDEMHSMNGSHRFAMVLAAAAALAALRFRSSGQHPRYLFVLEVCS